MAITLNGTTGITTPAISSTGASTFTGALALPSGGLTVGTDQLAVDSSGRVTMPYQPMFSAYGGGLGIGNYFVGYIGDTVRNNIGSHYSTASNLNKFTAPIAGLYSFSGGALKYSSNTVQLSLMINGSAFTQDYAEGSSGYQSCTLHAHVKLNQGDYVQLYAYGPASSFFDNGPGTSVYHFFTGCLLG